MLAATKVNRKIPSNWLKRATSTFRRGRQSPARRRPRNCRTATRWRQDASYPPTGHSGQRYAHSSEMSGQTRGALDALRAFARSLLPEAQTVPGCNLQTARHCGRAIPARRNAERPWSVRPLRQGDPPSWTRRPSGSARSCAPAPAGAASIIDSRF